METMHSSLENFADLLRQVQQTLSVKKREVSSAGNDLFSILDSTAAALALAKKPSNSFEEQIQKIFGDFGNGLREWKKEREKSFNLQKKIDSLGEGLVVMAFGRTNAGKSTLGNFLRGKQLGVAPFDNAWKNPDFKPAPIRIVTKDNNTHFTEATETWLEEGASETTREIQSFQLPGFVWVDTPGFGSLNDGTLGELARTYVREADLIIYLEDSDNPGLKEQTKNLIDMFEYGKENILMAINKSDRNVAVKGSDGKCILENGKIKMARVAKNPENRMQQEDYLISVLKERLEERSGNKKTIKAMSFSMLLATQAVKNNNDQMFTDSNMAEFFSRIREIVPNNKAMLDVKYNKAIKECIYQIDLLTGNAESGDRNGSLGTLATKLGEMENNIQQKDREFDVNQVTAEMIGALMAKIRPEISNFVQEMEKLQSAQNSASNIFPKSAPDSFTIDHNRLVWAVIQDANRILEQKARELFSDLFFKDALDIGRSFPAIESVQLKSQKEKQTYTVPGVKYVSRDPSGVWEHIKSRFGATYRRAVRTEEKREVIIDHGFNVPETIAQLNNKIEENLVQYIRASLEDIRNNCMGKGLEYISYARAGIRKAQDNLEQQKIRLQQSLN